MQLGMVTYMWGADWDLPTLIRNCTETGYTGVELRTTHRHGVEPELSSDARRDVRKQFEDSAVAFVGPGTACEYHSPDAAVVRRNIELTKRFIELSHDLGGTGVKVRPNALVDGEPRERTIERIGKALAECGEAAAGYGQQIRVEVHGTKTSDLPVFKQIMDAADHDQVVACWNSNVGEPVNGSIEEKFNLIKNKLGGTVHIRDLYDDKYPWRQLFSLLKKQGFEGFCLAECQASHDTLRVMRYFRALWLELSRDYTSRDDE